MLAIIFIIISMYKIIYISYVWMPSVGKVDSQPSAPARLPAPSTTSRQAHLARDKEG